MHRFGFLILTLALIAPACGDDGAPANPDSGGATDSGGGTDSGSTMDSGGGTDARTPTDSGGATDSGGGADAATVDATVPVDAAVPVDAKVRVDAGPPAAGECDPGACTPTCFRPIFCVTECGGPRTSCGCCSCKAPSFDDISCPAVE